jgi:hypothetical protein
MHEARRLLPLGEAIDPGIPQLETLRAFVNLGDGHRQEAVKNSKYMNHCEFFGLFYPERVSLIPSPSCAALPAVL